MKELLKAKGIELYSLIPLSSCKVIKPYLLEKNMLDENSSVVMMLIPYRSEIRSKNLSAYASVKDYHLFVSSLASELEEYMKKKHEGCRFKVFSDHSPIDEVHAACVAGLGFMGDNGLLINEKYSSFVFLCECITSLTPKELSMEYAGERKIRECLHCNACALNCPSGCIGKSVNGEYIPPRPKSECLSAITQKKGELTGEEIKMMLGSGCIWGCDICQNVCPFTKSSAHSPIDFFKNDVVYCLDSDTLSNMSDEELSTRPFAWRGRKTIERNVRLYEENK